MASCYLCLIKNENLIEISNVSKEASRLNMADVINKHFWFELEVKLCLFLYLKNRSNIKIIRYRFKMNPKNVFVQNAGKKYLIFMNFMN